jgi:hypothetical protein
MPLSIKHPEADRLARELAEKTGENFTPVVLKNQGWLSPQLLVQPRVAAG